jgi:hypothetical protein
MSESPSTPRDAKRTLILLACSAFCAGAAVIFGIDENPPGILLAVLAGVTFILAFAHPWRTARKFLYLLLAAIIGLVLFIAMSITIDSITQKPGASGWLVNLIDSPVFEALNLILIMLLIAAFLVGAVGALVMFIRGRRQPA